MTAPIDYRAYGPLYSGWARALSLLAALLLSGMLLVMPHLVAVETREIDHGLLSLALLGICCGFIHGVGFVPLNRGWRWLFGPWVAWPLMLLAAGWWFV
mgnify:CR=1 FL=1